MPKLTKRAVEAASPRETEYVVWDDEVRGFGLRVWPSGRKVFVFKYQLGGRAGRTQRVTLGEFGTLTAEQARREAVRLRGEVAAGRSPADARAARKHAIRDARVAPSIAELAEYFLADRAAKKKAATVSEYRRLLSRDVLPTLGPLKVTAISRPQVARLHLAMRERPYLANRALAVLGAMFRYAELHGMREPHTNPCSGIEPYVERSRERFLSEDEFAALGEALDRAAREGLPTPAKLRRKPRSAETAKHRPHSANVPKPANPAAVAAIRFLLLTGWRASEALSLRWEQIDSARGLATLPDTKTGKSVRYLGAAALDLLDSLPRLEGNPFVFPGRMPGAPLRELKRVWEALRAAAGLPDLRLHDLRHSHASVAVAGGLSLPVTGALLGHREVATTQRYAHLSAAPLRRAADDVAARIDTALGAGRRTRRVAAPTLPPITSSDV